MTPSATQQAIEAHLAELQHWVARRKREDRVLSSCVYDADPAIERIATAIAQLAATAKYLPGKVGGWAMSIDDEVDG